MMRIRGRCVWQLWCAGAVLLACGVSLCQTQVASPTVVLDTFSYWRIFHTLRPPVMRAADGLRPLLLNKPFLDEETPSPPDDWAKQDFDDSRWMRGPARLVPATPYLSRLCLRGKFLVTDPSAVRDLKITLEFQGGATVFVNGRRLTSAFLSSSSNGLADDYPAEVFLADDGGLLTFEASRRTLLPDDRRLRTLRRSLSADIPSSILRTGVNVVAIDITRAPYPSVVDEKKDPKAGHWNFAWNTCQLNAVRVTASAPDGLVPAGRRQPGFQVWHSNLLAGDYDVDFADPCEEITPLVLRGCRNGSFSGKVVVGNTQPIRALRAVPSQLRSASSTIPASRVRVRYGFPWGAESMTLFYDQSAYPAGASLLAGLTDEPPDEIPVRQKSPDPRLAKDGLPPVVAGAVAPVWVTVDVPGEAAPGVYTGTLTLSAAGIQPIFIPLELSVADFVLPDAGKRRTFVEMLQSPDTLAAEYGVAPWSEEHWNLISASFCLIRESGSRVIYIPLICETNFGNEESMVRWVRKPDGSFGYDFSVMERYLDTARQALGTPELVVFVVWDVYMSEKTDGSASSWHTMREGSGKGGIYGMGPVVTGWDPAAGKAQRLVLPRYTDAASEPLWKPLFDQIRQKMAERGIEQAMALGMMTDIWPSKAEAEFFARVAPGAGWVAHTHYFGGSSLHGVAPVSYRTAVWTISNATTKSLMGWKRPDLLARYWRQLGFDTYPSSQWRHLSEFAVTGDQRGTGRLGGDFWEVLKDRSGQRKARIYSRYPQSNWRNLDIYVSLLCPGPRRPAATQHYIAFLEGVQEAEARIVIEDALSDPAKREKLGEDLVHRCQTLLADRLRDMQRCFTQYNNRLDGSPASVGSTCGPGTAGHFWFLSSDWESRTEALFRLAGEVAEKVR